jgi:hypothetical protein
MYTFTGAIDGSNPHAALTLSRTTFYGTASAGGFYGSGTVFSLSYPQPQIRIIPYGENAILTWPTDVSGFSFSTFSLESASNLGQQPAWTKVSSVPVVIGGQNVVIQPISSALQFFRLSQ